MIWANCEATLWAICVVLLWPNCQAITWPNCRGYNISRVPVSGLQHLGLEVDKVAVMSVHLKVKASKARASKTGAASVQQSLAVLPQVPILL